MTAPEPGEDFAQLLAAIKDEYGLASDSELARRLEVNPSTVSVWVNRRRGTSRGPHPSTLRKISEIFPKFTPARVHAAAGRRTPGPLTPDQAEKLLEYFGELTEEQQQAALVQMRALAEYNRSGS